MPMPATIAAAITVVPLDDPVVERHGHGPNSTYVSVCYLPILGDRPCGFIAESV